LIVTHVPVKVFAFMFPVIVSPFLLYRYSTGRFLNVNAKKKDLCLARYLLW
jgi:hypothetical protein